MKIDNATLSFSTVHHSSSGTSHISFQELLGREQNLRAPAPRAQSPSTLVSQAKDSLLQLTHALMKKILARLDDLAQKNGSGQDGEVELLQNRLMQLASFRVDVQLLADKDWVVTPKELQLLQKLEDTLTLQTPSGRVMTSASYDNDQLEEALALMAEALAPTNEAIGKKQLQQLTTIKRFIESLPPSRQQEQLLNNILDLLQGKGRLANSVGGFYNQKLLRADQNPVAEIGRNITLDQYFEKESCQFTSGGVVTTSDGREIDFTLRMSMDREFVDSAKVVENVVLTDPLVVNFAGSACELSDMAFNFDLNADGREENISCLKPGSGFLAFDINKDGVINNGSELFGPETGSGFGELSQYDGDGNHWIDENDRVFDSLLVWSKTETGDSLQTLQDTGIGALCLDNMATPFTYKDKNNSTLGNSTAAGVLLMENGTAGSIQEINLADRGSREKTDGIGNKA
jgi:hypothetical protein